MNHMGGIIVHDPVTISRLQKKIDREHLREMGGSKECLCGRRISMNAKMCSRCALFIAESLEKMHTERAVEPSA